MTSRALPDGWRVGKLGELGQVVTGKTPPTKHTEYYGGEIPFITPTDMDGRKVIATTGRYLTGEGIQSVRSSLIPSGTVFVSCIGSDMGKVGIAGASSVTNQQINSIIVEPPNDNQYVYYQLSTRKAEFQRLATSGSAQPILNKGHFWELDIVLPPPEEQRAIAHILGTLDDKIELNRRINQTLEEMAQALFKSWFADFEPFREQGMQDSPLGGIPVGWGTGTLSQICEVKMGQSPPGYSYNEMGDGIPFYQGIRDFGFRFPQHRVYCTMPTRFAEPHDVLLSVRAPVGSLNIANERCAIGRGLAALCSKERRHSYLYHLLRNVKTRWDTFNSEGTVFGCITKRDIVDIEIILPPVAIAERFESVASMMDQLIANNEQETSTLSYIRDALLPKLLSGEIRVKDAEKFVEKAI